jgi:hypothetical protein
MACITLYDPVCGCDGRTYGNECEANAAGVRVASRGACGTTSFCASVRCAPGTYCCESRRACIPMEEACSPTGACSNDSHCASGYLCCAGTGRCYNAACLGCCMVVSTPCTSNSDCRSTQYCAGSGCGTRGTCQDRPTLCLDVYRPVCGCDGRTHSNDCYAAAAGVRVASNGPCS